MIVDSRYCYPGPFSVLTALVTHPQPCTGLASCSPLLCPGTPGTLPLCGGSGLWGRRGARGSWDPREDMSGDWGKVGEHRSPLLFWVEGHAPAIVGGRHIALGSYRQAWRPHLPTPEAIPRSVIPPSGLAVRKVTELMTAAIWWGETVGPGPLGRSHEDRLSLRPTVLLNSGPVFPGLWPPSASAESRWARQQVRSPAPSLSPPPPDSGPVRCFFLLPQAEPE